MIVRAWAWGLGLGAWGLGLEAGGLKIRAMRRSAVSPCFGARRFVRWPAPPRAQPQDPGPKPQVPVFRAGVELVSVDITALDNNGRQVTDLTAAELEVEIDGSKRQVSTVEYIRSADPLRVIGAPHKVVVPDETFSSSNAKGAPRGRLIVLLIDQGNIRTGAARSSMNSAKKFVDTLTPEDRVSVIAVPSPGELVDFTTDHDKVREALLRVVGTAEALEVALQPVDHRVDGDLHALRHADGDRGDPPRVRGRRRGVGARAVRARSRTGCRRDHQRDPPPHAGFDPRHARRLQGPGCARGSQVGRS